VCVFTQLLQQTARRHLDEALPAFYQITSSSGSTFLHTTQFSKIFCKIKNEIHTLPVITAYEGLQYFCILGQEERVFYSVLYLFTKRITPLVASENTRTC